jgi:hypothetical protein
MTRRVVSIFTCDFCLKEKEETQASTVAPAAWRTFDLHDHKRSLITTLHACGVCITDTTIQVAFDTAKRIEEKRAAIHNRGQ